MIEINNSSKIAAPYTAVILADSRSDRIAHRINSFLLGSNVCADGRISVLYHTDRADFSEKSSIVLLLGGEDAARSCPAGTTVAVSSANHAALRVLSSRKHHAVICGMYSHDTFTLSSYDRDCALVALQRTVLSLDGSEIEPREIKIHLTHIIPSSDIPLIAAAMLLGGGDCEKEFEI